MCFWIKLLFFKKKIDLELRLTALNGVLLCTFPAPCVLYFLFFPLALHDSVKNNPYLSYPGLWCSLFYPLSQMSCYSSCPFNKTAVLSLAIPDKLMVSIVIYIKALLDIAQSQE